MFAIIEKGVESCNVKFGVGVNAVWVVKLTESCLGNDLREREGGGERL